MSKLCKPRGMTKRFPSTKKGKNNDARNPLLRTVYLPAGNGDSYQMVVDSLTKQLEEQKELALSREKLFFEDRRIKDEEKKALENDCKRRFEEMQGRIEKLEAENVMETKEHLKYRREIQMKMLQLTEINSKLKMGQIDLAEATREAVAKAEEKAEAETRESLSQADDYVEAFRKQAIQNETNLVVVKNQFREAKVNYESQISNLTKRWKRLKTRHSKLENRRLLDLEGFQNDLRALAERINKVEHFELDYDCISKLGPAPRSLRAQ